MQREEERLKGGGKGDGERERDRESGDRQFLVGKGQQFSNIWKHRMGILVKDGASKE